MWEEWAQNRNANLLPGEKPFRTNFCDLSIPEMDFWLSRFVLEVRKQKDGEPYPPNTLYQLVCGLQRQLRESGRAEIKLLDNPSLNGFKATLDGEMMRSHFVLEVRKQKDGEPYPPNTLYQLVCGLQRQLRESGRAEIKLLDNPSLHGFKATLDGEMMRLNSTGNYLDKKQAQLISIAEEERLWELGLLGDHNPDVLLHTLVYQIGLFLQ